MQSKSNSPAGTSRLSSQRDKGELTKESALDQIPEHPPTPTSQSSFLLPKVERSGRQASEPTGHWSSRPRAETEPLAQQALTSISLGDRPRRHFNSHGDINYLNNRLTLEELLGQISVSSISGGLGPPITSMKSALELPVVAAGESVQRNSSAARYAAESPKVVNPNSTTVHREATVTSSLQSVPLGSSNQTFQSATTVVHTSTAKAYDPKDIVAIEPRLHTPPRRQTYTGGSQSPASTPGQIPPPTADRSLSHLITGPFVLVHFKGFRHEIYELPLPLMELALKAGDWVVVEGDRGVDFGQIADGPFSFAEAQSYKTKYDEAWSDSMMDLVEGKRKGYLVDTNYNRKVPVRQTSQQPSGNSDNDPPGDVYQPASGNLNSLSASSRSQIHGPRLNTRSDRVLKVIREGQHPEITTYMREKAAKDEGALALVQSKASELGFEMNVLDAEWQW